MELKPMLLTEIKPSEIEGLEKQGWLFSEKENGIRVIAMVKNHKLIALRGRNNNPCLFLFPELKDLEFKADGIFDGEAIVELNGKSVYYGGIDQRSRALHNERIETCPVKLIFFDLIKLNNEVVVNKPFKERYRLLKENVEDNCKIRVTSITEKGIELWNKIQKEKREGIVARNPNAMYELGTRSKNVLKIKDYKEAEAIAETFEKNEKGCKVFGTAKIDDKEVKVEFQYHNRESIEKGEKIQIKYLELIEGKEGLRITQPTIA